MRIHVLPAPVLLVAVATLVVLVAGCTGGPSGPAPVSPSLSPSTSPAASASAITPGPTPAPSASAPVTATPPPTPPSPPATVEPRQTASPSPPATMSPTRSPRPSPPAVPATGTVAGQALAGPTCPVAKYPADPACADRPVSGVVVVVTAEDGSVAATATTGPDGRYAVRLAPGTYTVAPQPVQGLMRTPPPVTVEVADGVTVTVDLAYDTGIR